MTGTQLVENVIVALVGRLEHNSRLLQQIGAHMRTDDAVGGVEIDLDVLAEPGTVIVPDRLGVSYCLHYGV